VKEGCAQAQAAQASAVLAGSAAPPRAPGAGPRRSAPGRHIDVVPVGAIPVIGIDPPRARPCDRPRDLPVGHQVIGRLFIARLYILQPDPSEYRSERRQNTAGKLRLRRTIQNQVEHRALRHRPHIAKEVDSQQFIRYAPAAIGVQQGEAVSPALLPESPKRIPRGERKKADLGRQGLPQKLALRDRAHRRIHIHRVHPLDERQFRRVAGECEACRSDGQHVCAAGGGQIPVGLADIFE